MKKILKITQLGLFVIAANIVSAQTTFAAGYGYGHTPEETSISGDLNILFVVGVLVYACGLSIVLSSKALKSRL